MVASLRLGLKALFWMAFVVAMAAFHMAARFVVALTRNSPSEPNPASGQVYRFEVRGPGDVYVTAREHFLSEWQMAPALALIALFGLYFWVFGPPSDDEKFLAAAISIGFVGVQLFFFPGTFFGR